MLFFLKNAQKVKKFLVGVKNEEKSTVDELKLEITLTYLL